MAGFTDITGINMTGWFRVTGRASPEHLVVIHADDWRPMSWIMAGFTKIGGINVICGP